MSVSDVIKYHTIVVAFDESHGHQTIFLLTWCVPNLQIFLRISVESSQTLKICGWYTGLGPVVTHIVL
jgi:hypothetical protein